MEKYMNNKNENDIRLHQGEICEAIDRCMDATVKLKQFLPLAAHELRTVSDVCENAIELLDGSILGGWNSIVEYLNTDWSELDKEDADDLFNAVYDGTSAVCAADYALICIGDNLVSPIVYGKRKLINGRIPIEKVEPLNDLFERYKSECIDAWEYLHDLWNEYDTYTDDCE